MSADLPPPVLGAHVAGWSAFVLDVLFNRHAAHYLAAMSPQQRRDVERTHAAVHLAALHWKSASVDGSAEATAAEAPPVLVHDEITTAQAAGLLDVTERRVCQLAAGWADHGLARKVGRSWVVDRQAVLLHRKQTRGAA